MKRPMVIIVSCFLITLVIFGANMLMEKASDVAEASKTEKTSEELIQDKRPEQWVQYIFPQDEVIEIRLYIDEDQYDYMVENASSELFVPADIVYNGIKLENIGIRPKGNSSLRQAISEGKEQFSFKLKFDEYLSQNLYGITAIGLNNCYSDASYIREIMSYEIIEEMGLPAPGTTFCNVYINDELAGLYLSVQQIDEVFTAAWFDDGDGDLFKPEGTGANLVYTDENYASYSGLGERTNVDDEGEEAVVEMIKSLSTGENLEDVLYVDLVLKYHALNTAMLSLDSYMGGMFHNYYLYGEDGKYMIIPWDYNMSFGGFGMGSNQSEDETQFYIDEPTSGAISNYPLINALLSIEEYLEQYHGYLEALLSGPLEIETFKTRAEALTAMIDEYVKNDPEPMSAYEAFQNALYDTGETITSEGFPVMQNLEDVNENQSTSEMPQPAVANVNNPGFGERPERPTGETAQELGERQQKPATADGSNTQGTSENTETSRNALQFMKAPAGGIPSASPLVTFVENWTENILKQLSGELASTNNGEGNQAGMRDRMDGNRNLPMILTDTASGTAFDPSVDMAMNGNGRPEIPQAGRRPPEGFDESEGIHHPPDGAVMGGNPPQRPEDMEEMPVIFENGSDSPSDYKRASIGLILVGNDAPKYFLIIIAAIFVMLLSLWVKKKK